MDYKYVSTQHYNKAELEIAWRNKKLRNLLKQAGVESPEHGVRLTIEMENPWSHKMRIERCVFNPLRNFMEEHKIAYKILPKNTYRDVILGFNTIEDLESAASEYVELVSDK